ncbi:hypothetical protein PLESTB_000565200 [Pleodorina starrii]|uniref:LisH domain-containing protein n=1 Tax=Pleodorina starrii TaxID=330485 RepID=A0A9W6BGT7_9CHLO|nr:hypothetical protein PLESTB_000565200 [Pleodorina starrii]
MDTDLPGPSMAAEALEITIRGSGSGRNENDATVASRSSPGKSRGGREGRLPAREDGGDDGDGDGGGDSGGLLLGLVLKHLLCKGLAGTAAVLAREASRGGGGGDGGGAAAAAAAVGRLVAGGRLEGAALRQRLMRDVRDGRILSALHRLESHYCAERCLWCGVGGGGGGNSADADFGGDGDSDSDSEEEDEEEDDDGDAVLYGDGFEEADAAARITTAAPRAAGGARGSPQKSPLRQFCTAPRINADGGAGVTAIAGATAAPLLHWRLRLQLFLGLVAGGAPYTALEFARRHLRRVAPPPECTAWGLQREILTALERNGEAATAAATATELWLMLGLGDPRALWPSSPDYAAAAAADPAKPAIAAAAAAGAGAAAGGGAMRVGQAAAGSGSAAWMPSTPWLRPPPPPSHLTAVPPAAAAAAAAAPSAAAAETTAAAAAVGTTAANSRRRAHGRRSGFGGGPSAGPSGPATAPSRPSTASGNAGLFSCLAAPASETALAGAGAWGGGRGSGSGRGGGDGNRLDQGWPASRGRGGGRASSSPMERRAKLPRVMSPLASDVEDEIRLRDQTTRIRNQAAAPATPDGSLAVAGRRRAVPAPPSALAMALSAPGFAASTHGPRVGTRDPRVGRTPHSSSSSSSSGCSSDSGGSSDSCNGGSVSSRGADGDTDSDDDGEGPSDWPRPETMLRYHGEHERRRAAAVALADGDDDGQCTIADTFGGGTAAARAALPLQELQEALSLLAYTDPRVAPAARLLGPAAHDTLAEQLNAELLRVEASIVAAAAAAGAASAAAAGSSGGDTAAAVSGRFRGGGGEVVASAIHTCTRGLGMLRVLDDTGAGERHDGGGGKVVARGAGRADDVAGFSAAAAATAAVAADPARSPLEALYCQCTAVWDELGAADACPEALLVDWRAELWPMPPDGEPNGTARPPLTKPTTR